MYVKPSLVELSAMIRALVFDFDGLILDTEGPDYCAWQEIFQERGCNLPLELWCDCIGRSADWFDPIAYLEDRLGRSLDREAILLGHRRRHHHLLEAQQILPGIESYLTDAARLGLRIGIASSSSRQWVLGHLERLGLGGHWECIRCWDDVESAKPAPDLYLAVLEHLGVSASEAVAFEDSPNGIAAAKAAGIFCVAVPNGLTADLDLSGADMCLRSLARISLPELLSRIADRSPQAGGASGSNAGP
jgi:HAD superfamily hydrolase (TIGR01509 family)